MITCPIGGSINISAVVDAINLNETTINAHIQDLSNPHDVTAAQVGAEPELGLGTAGQVLATNQTTDGKEWIDVQTEVNWGDIEGTLSNQTDLQDALNLKVSSDISVDTGSNAILNMVSLTQAEYDALTPVETTLYIIAPDAIKFSDNYDPFKDSSGIALWKFDNSLIDLSGNHTGTIDSGTEEYKSCGSYTGFNGNYANSIIIPPIPITGDMSFSLWVSLTDITVLQDIFSFFTSFRRIVRVDSTGLLSYANGSTAVSSFTFTQDQEYHIVLNVSDDGSNTNVDFFVDGNLHSSGSCGTANSASGTDHISSGSNGSADFITGCIRQCRVFNRLLTQEEVSTIYSNEG